MGSCFARHGRLRNLRTGRINVRLSILVVSGLGPNIRLRGPMYMVSRLTLTLRRRMLCMRSLTRILQSLRPQIRKLRSALLRRSRLLTCRAFLITRFARMGRRMSGWRLFRLSLLLLMVRSRLRRRMRNRAVVTSCPRRRMKIPHALGSLTNRKQDERYEKKSYSYHFFVRFSHGVGGSLVLVVGDETCLSHCRNG